MQFFFRALILIIAVSNLVLAGYCDRLSPIKAVVPQSVKRAVLIPDGVVGDKFYFRLRSRSGVGKLWEDFYVSDGTCGGTHLIKQFVDRLDEDSYWSGVAGLGNWVFFTVRSLETVTPSSQLWASDGGVDSAILLQEQFYGSLTNALLIERDDAQSEGLFSKSALYLGATSDIDGAYSTGLTRIYLDESGQPKLEIVTGKSRTANPGLTRTDGGHLWMWANKRFYRYKGSFIRSTGTAGEERIFRPKPGGKELCVKQMLAMQNSGKLLVTDLCNSGSNSHMWLTDGSTAGTTALTLEEGSRGLSVEREIAHGIDLGPRFRGRMYMQYDPTNERAFFTSIAEDDPLEHRTLWATAENNTVLRTIYPREPHSCHYSFSNRGVVFGGVYYFTAPSDPQVCDSRRVLWRTDGTHEGTYIVSDQIGPYPYLLPHARSHQLRDMRYWLYGYDGSTRKYWISDGTTAGTRMIPIPRTKTPYLTNLYQFQGYFLATVYTPKFGKAVTLARLDMDDPYVQGVDAQRPEPFQLDRSCFKRSYRRGANLDRLHPKKQANRDARKGERKSKRKGKRKKRKRRAKNSR